MATETKLTKKQQKALKHRSRDGKGKGKAGEDEQAAFPEAEDLDDDGTAAAAAKLAKSIAKKEKKAKKATVDDGLPYSPLDTPFASSSKPKDASAGKKRKREEAGGDEAANTETKAAAVPKKAKKAKTAESKTRYIVFVGNLPYKVEVDDIIKHFEEACSEKPSVRLLTSKTGGTSKNPAIAAKTKGCAFVEFKSSAAVQSALHLHQSMFVSSASSAKRKINVELTAGGGGNSDTRKQKLAALKERLEKQRENHKTEADIAREEKEEQDKATRAEWKRNEAAQEKAKKANRAPKFISGSNSTKLG